MSRFEGGLHGLKSNQVGHLLRLRQGEMVAGFQRFQLSQHDDGEPRRDR
jgi:hypothetical protein